MTDGNEIYKDRKNVSDDRILNDMQPPDIDNFDDPVQEISNIFNLACLFSGIFKQL